MEIEKKLAGLGLELPTPPKPAAHYIPYVQTGHLLFVGGNTDVGARLRHGTLLRPQSSSDYQVGAR